jgi:hypothetical protein
MTATGRRRDRERHDLCRAVNQILWAWPHARLDAESRGFGFGTGGSDTGTGSGDHSDPTSRAAIAGLDTPHPGHTLSEALIQARAEIWLTEWRRLAAQICVDVGVRLPRWEPEHATERIRTAAGQVNPVPPLTRSVFRLADQALAWWPSPPTSTKRGVGKPLGVDPEDDGNCGLCGLPAPSGRDFETGQRLARTINGVRYHNTAKSGTACFWVRWRELQNGRQAG